ncbi:MAG: MarR family transcriptional regulator [Thermomicrobiales bacterium]
MESSTEQDELIERALDALPRFKRSMLQHMGGPPHRHGRRGGPHWGRGGRGRGKKAFQERLRGRWGGPGSPAQMRIAMQLYRRGPAKVGDIASWIGVSAPTASEQIDGLVEAGLAERTVNPDDRREVLVELTPKAIELSDYFWNLQRSRVTAVFERFSPEERPIVVRTLEAFADVFEQDPAKLDDCGEEAEA